MRELFNIGGPIVWILCAFSIYGLGVVAERLFYFHRVRINSGDLLRGLSLLLRKGSYAEALHEVSRAPGPVARVIESALCRPNADRQELHSVVTEAAQLEVFHIEKNIRGLLTTATVAPLLGLLGTLLSLIKFFYQTNPSNSNDDRLMSLGVSQAVFEALITSAIGLAIAVPAYLFYMFLAARARKVINEVERAGIETVNIISDTKRIRPQDDKEEENSAEEKETEEKQAD